MNIKKCLSKLEHLYDIGSKDEQTILLQTLSSVLKCSAISELNLEALRVDTITKLPNRNSLMLDIQNLQNDAMLILLNINQLDLIKQLYGYKLFKEIILDKADKLRHLSKDGEATLYSLNFQKFAILVTNNLFFNKYFSLLEFSIFNNIESFSYQTNKNETIISDFTAGVAYGRTHLLHSANVALQEAMLFKKHCVVYEKHSDTLSTKRISLDKHRIYKTALHDGDVVPYFQPIANTHDGSIVKYEALARLLLADGTVISPSEFLNTAMEDKTFEFFSRQMMQKVFNIYTNNSVEIAINLTYDNIRSASMLEYIKNRLEKYGGEKITFEIVETEDIEDYSIVESFILLVKEYGCKISIDDFGSGYSNFTNLIKLNIDYIKIDGSIVSKSITDEKAFIMIRGLVQFAKSINVQTVAEFVSSKELYEAMKELGVDFVQGYYFGEPKSALEYGLLTI